MLAVVIFGDCEIMCGGGRVQRTFMFIFLLYLLFTKSTYYFNNVLMIIYQDREREAQAEYRHLCKY